MKGNNFFKLRQSDESIAFNRLKERLDAKDIGPNPMLMRLFNIFDENNDKVLGKKEIRAIWDTFNMYATSDGNNILDPDETIEFLNIVATPNSKVSEQVLHQFLSTLQSQKESPVETQEDTLKQSQTTKQITLTDEQAKGQVVSALASDVNSAYVLYNNSHNGVVTKGYDAIKNYFDGDLGSSNVEEVLALQDEAVNFLLGAQEGSLSKKEYYLENVDHLKKMIKRRLFVKEEASGISFIDRYRDSYSEKQLEQIVDNYLNKYISNLGTIENIKNIQARLTQCTEEGNQAFLEKFLQDALNTPQSGGKTPDNIGVKDSYNIGMSIPIENNSDEPVTFEEVFKLERGREYNKEKVEEYLNHQAESSYVISAYNNYQTFALNVKELENETDINNLANKTVELFENNFPTNAFEKLKYLINKNNLPIKISQSENGEIEFDTTVFENNQETGVRILKSIAKFAVQDQKKELNNVIGGEPEEKLLEIKQRGELLYDLAYGNDFPEALVQAMKNDNSTAIEKYTGVATTGGMLMLAAGTLLAIPTGGTSLIAAGGALAMGGMGANMALSTVEHFSKDLVTSEEEKVYRDMMITNAGGLLIGMGAGKLGDKLFNQFIDKKLVEVFNQAVNNGNRTELAKDVLTNQELLGKFLKAGGIKVGADFTLSLAGDLAMMGAFDTNEDWLSLVKANLVGILMSTGSDVGNLSKEFKTKKITSENIDLEGLQALQEKAQQPVKGIEDTQRKSTNAFAEKLYSDKEFPKEHIEYILKNTNNDNIALAEKLCSDKEFPKEYISDILRGTNKENIQFVEKLCDDKEFPKDRLSYLIRYSGNKIAEKLCIHQEIDVGECMRILHIIDTRGYKEKEISFIENLLLYSNKNFLSKDLFSLVVELHNVNLEFAERLFADKDFPKEHIGDILYSVNKEKLPLAEALCADKEFPKEYIGDILRRVSKEKLPLAEALCADKDFPKEHISSILWRAGSINLSFAKKLCTDKEFPKEHISSILWETNENNLVLAEKLYADKAFPPEEIATILMVTTKDNISFAEKLCEEYSKLEIPIEKLNTLIVNSNSINYLDTKKLIKKMGKDNVKKLSNEEFLLACQMVDIYHVKNINEIPQAGKKELLRRLVKCNEGLFKTTDRIKEAFPLIPTNKDEYCTLLPSIVRSLGIETNTLKPDEVNNFNKSVSEAATCLAKLSDNDFANLNITQEMSKNDFIKLVLEKTKELSSKERQKVYDYFGFELHHSKKNPTGYTITGYPVNLNNGKKLAQITNLKTKEVVELLRPDVIKFSENNKVKCNNPEVERILNEIVDVLPELRVQLGKPQHRNHSYDVLQHSLKVMQKIAQDPKFEKLNDDDKKIMLLASLLHDVTKREGSVDKTHANESSFDSFFIAKKFNLPREQELKLYTLIKHHEWLEYVNTSKNEEVLTKRLQSVAFDLQHENLFDMALMFTNADLRAVKTDDSFRDTMDGSNRTTIEGVRRSFGDSAEVYAQRIKDYVQELQKSKPILPVTQIPTMSRIKQAIMDIKPDGTTNLKGIYVDSNGMVIIKFNEVEDWELIGFSKGTCSHGISAKGVNKAGEECDVDTGNIKFFAHALDYENQLTKFDAFSLVDNDALLSVSYAERPESKYRFFRPQGVLLNFDTTYIHGGGNTDSGSGCGKNIEEFKSNYIFGGERESERVYVSNLIKEATGMDDEQYVRFVGENKNKSFSEIYPVEIREAIIKALATINSNVRKGNREYNEMYGSNPQPPMAVFAYSIDYTERIENPIEFLSRTTINSNEHHSFGNAPAKSVSERTEFLRRYALEHDIPFVIFGD